LNPKLMSHYAVMQLRRQLDPNFNVECGPHHTTLSYHTRRPEPTPLGHDSSRCVPGAPTSTPAPPPLIDMALVAIMAFLAGLLVSYIYVKEFIR
jgi:hypothetical protein